MAGPPKAEFVPVYKAFFRRASVKSEEELGLVRYAAAIGEAMSETLRATARPGVSEAELVAAVTATSSPWGYTAEVLLGTGPEYRLGPPAWQYRSQAPRVLRRATSCCRKSSPLRPDGNPAPGGGGGRRGPSGHPARRRRPRASYEAGVAALRAGNTFGDLVDAMEAPACIRRLACASAGPQHQPLRSGRLWHRARLEAARAIRSSGRCRPSDGNCPCSPACARNPLRLRHLANIGGTVIVGEQAGIALNENSTRLMRAD